MRSTGKLRLAAAVAAAMIMPILSACGGDSGSAAKSNADLLKEGAANMKAVKSYRLDADITQADQAIKMGGDIDVANKNSNLAMTVSGQNINMITVGSNAYVSADGGNTYTKGDASSANMSGLTDMWNSFKPEDIDKAKDALKDASPATETIDGVATKHMTGNAKDLAALASGGTSSSTTVGTIDMWVSTDAKPLVRQMKIDGTSDGKALKATFKWGKFDETFVIKAPDNVK